MLRKMLSLLLLSALLLSLLPARAEDAPPALFRLIDVSEDGSERLMGTAVLFSDHETLLTTVWAMPFGGTVKAVGPDGDYALASAVRLTEESEMVLLTLERPCEAAEPMQLLTSGSAADAALVVGCTLDGAVRSIPQSDVKPARYGALDACLISAPAALAPGALVLDAQGMLSGLVVAAWGEKPGYYAALTRPAMAQDFITLTQAAMAADNWLDAPQITYDQGVLTVDWSAEVQTEESSRMHVYLIDQDNHFYSWYLISGAQDSVELPVTPGRSYGLWLQHSQSEEREWDAAPMAPAARITIPPAQPLTAHGFQSQLCYLAFAPAGDNPDGAALLPPLEPISAQTLTDESLRLYLQVTDTYQVDEELETALVIALTTPDGQCFSLLSGYIYMPSLCDGDCWNAEVTDLIRGAMGMGAGPLSGEYTLTYYIGGDFAGQTAFTLE